MNHFHFPLSLSTLILAVFLISCSKTYEVRSVALQNKKDSISYSMGYMSGMQSSFYVVKDSTGQALLDFMHAYDDAVGGSLSRHNTAYQQGYQLGLGVKNFEQNGMYYRKMLPLNGPVLLQGFVNGLYVDSTQMTYSRAREIYNKDLFPKVYRNLLHQTIPAQQCPWNPVYIELSTISDTVSYMSGWINGIRIGEKLTADNRDSEIREYIEGLNAALQTQYANPGVAVRGVGLGCNYYNWSKKGKIGDVAVDIRPKYYYQGLINGLHQDTTMMTMPKAIAYMQENCSDLVPSNK